MADLVLNLFVRKPLRTKLYGETGLLSLLVQEPVRFPGRKFPGVQVK